MSPSPRGDGVALIKRLQTINEKISMIHIRFHKHRHHNSDQLRGSSIVNRLSICRIFCFFQGGQLE